MSLSEIYKYFISIGNGLLSKIKYGYNYKYSVYRFARLRFEKQRLEQKKLRKILYKKK